ESLTAHVNAYERLPGLRVPTLVVIGELDRDFVRNAPHFIERMPPDLVRTVTIEGGGHAANVERREAFEAALLEFASDIGYAGEGTGGWPERQAQCSTSRTESG
ncbi:MAG TPA: alpha/beta hydrolase, partial [Tepidiformaceae bacterium]